MLRRTFRACRQEPRCSQDHAKRIRLPDRPGFSTVRIRLLIVLQNNFVAVDLMLYGHGGRRLAEGESLWRRGMVIDFTGGRT